MPRFAANLSMLYPELDFLDRFEAAAKDGFQAVEYLFLIPTSGASWRPGCRPTACSRYSSTARPAIGRLASVA